MLQSMGPLPPQIPSYFNLVSRMSGCITIATSSKGQLSYNCVIKHRPDGGDSIQEWQFAGLSPCLGCLRSLRAS